MYICIDRQVDKAILTPLRRLRTLALHAGAGSAGGGEIWMKAQDRDVLIRLNE